MKIKLLLFLVVITLISMTMVSADIVINELMPDPSGEEPDMEWFELYNSGPDPVDLLGWTISDGESDHEIIVDAEFFWLGSEEYLVLCRSAEALDNCDYVYAGLNLANVGDELSLENKEEELEDLVEFTGFPYENGVSAELVHYLAENNDVDYWYSSVAALGEDFGTPGAENSVFDGESPVVEDAWAVPPFPDVVDDVDVCATVTDESGVGSVNLNWDNGEDSGSLAMIGDGEGNYCRDLSATTVDPVDAMVVTYSITTTDVFGNEDTVEDEDFFFVYDGENPVAEFTCDELEGDESHTIECTSTSSDTVSALEDLEHLWDFGDGETSDEQNPEHTYEDDGVYLVTLTVTDESGKWDTSEEQSIEVFDVGPEAAFDYFPEEEVAYEGEEIEFEDESESHDGIVSWEWDFGDGETSDEANPTHTYADDGEYLVSLTVCEEDGDCDTIEMVVEVLNKAPEVLVEDFSCDEGETITLSAEAEDVEADLPLTYEWDLDGDEEYETVGQEVEYECGNGDDVVTVSVRVTDNDEEPASTEVDVTINNVPPEADAGGPYKAASFEEVCFDGSASDVVDEEFSFEWDFDYNGEFDVDSEDEDACTTYWERDEVTIALRVWDGDDYSDVVTSTVTVYDYSIPLDEEWNLISIPLVPQNTAIEEVLNGVVPEAVWAYMYDEETGKNEWFFFDGDAPEGVGSLEEMIPGYGYYVLMEESGDILLNGEKYYEIGLAGIPMPPQVTLTTGWNLIGHYGMNEVNKEDEVQDLSGGSLTDLADVTVLGKDASPLDVLIPRKGYWAFITGQENLLYAPSEADYEDNGDEV